MTRRCASWRMGDPRIARAVERDPDATVLEALAGLLDEIERVCDAEDARLAWWLDGLTRGRS